MMIPTEPTPEYLRHTASIGAFEDAPETKSRYEVSIGGLVMVRHAYDAPDAERQARRVWRITESLAPDAPTPEAVAQWVGKAVTK